MNIGNPQDWLTSPETIQLLLESAKQETSKLSSEIEKINKLKTEKMATLKKLVFEPDTESLLKSQNIQLELGELETQLQTATKKLNEYTQTIVECTTHVKNIVKMLSEASKNKPK